MQKLDQRLSQPIHTLKLGVLDYLLVAPGLMFGSYVMPATIFGLGLWLGWRWAAVATMAAITTVAITSPMKHYFGRLRPGPLGAPRRVPLRAMVNNPAFPSGDSAQAGMIVVLLVAAGPFDDARRWWFVPLAPLCMFSRVYYGAHWVGDTLAGVAIGAGIGLLYGYWFGAWMAAS